MNQSFIKNIYIVAFILFNISFSQLLSDGCITTLNTDNRKYKLTSFISAHASYEKIIAQDAPKGNVVFKTSSPYVRFISDPIPANSLGKYQLQAFTRRTISGVNTTDVLWIAACLLDINKEKINGQGTCFYHYVDKLDVNKYYNDKNWKHAKFEVGVGTSVNLPANTAYMTMGFWLNCRNSSQTFQINGIQITDLGTQTQLKPSQINCPLSRLFQLNILTGFDKESKSDNLNLKLSFFDQSANILAILPLRWGLCNAFESGNIDTVRVCANWVQKVKKMKLSVSQSDEMQVESMTVSLGTRIATKSRFWLDNENEGKIYGGWPVYSSLQFKM